MSQNACLDNILISNAESEGKHKKENNKYEAGGEKSWGKLNLSTLNLLK